MKYGLLLLALSALAEAPSPKVSAELRSNFWRAKASLTAAQLDLERANKSLVEVIKAMTDVCGSQTLEMGQDGEPACKAEGKQAPTLVPRKE